MSVYGLTKAERREQKKTKQREKMNQGKKIKLLDRLVMERAERARKKLEELDVYS